jgi:plasmid maintenance system killer protein
LIGVRRLSRRIATRNDIGYTCRRGDQGVNASTGARDMNLPGLDLHELRGARKGTWAVKVSGNWRVTFTCAGKDVEQVDYEDYH